jgi:hypothetical protein
MKVYSKMYNANSANIAKASPPLTVTANKMTCFQIPFPSEGFMERVVVYQATGAPVAFSVEILNSRIPYPPGDYVNGAAAADKLENYRIQVPPTSALTAASGAVLTVADENFGEGFRNVDGGFTLNQRYIYLLINPTGNAGTTTWNVTLQCRTDVG